MVKWMAQDRAGRAVLDRMKSDDFFTICKVLESTANAGHIDVLRYLFEIGWPDEDATTLIEAASGGHLDCVKWLLENAPPYGQDHYAEYAVVSAATHGHLNILQFFHELHLNESAHPSHVDGDSSTKRRRTGQIVDWWDRADEALAEAVTEGHLEVVKWLHLNHFEGSGQSSLDKPAQNGHLEMMKWLQENTEAKCTASAMTNAAFNGHLEVCKWLHANRSEGCYRSAVKYAIGNGHLRVAHWLRLHYPQHVPEHNRLWKYPPNTFDMLLFLQVHYPTLFTLEFGRGTKNDLQHDKAKGGDHLIARWLDARYPGRATERHQLVMWPVMI